jgi:hypothetical protein
MVDPIILCKQHLLGEHLEVHMFVGSIIKNKNLSGFLKGGLLEVHSLQIRHDQLVVEMEKRGMKHNSPLPYFSSYQAGHVDTEKSLLELLSRCEQCRRNYNG